VRYLTFSFICAAMAVALGVGCDRGEAEPDADPRATFEAFLMHWYRGNAELAFDYVLPADREALTKPLEAAADLPEAQRPTPADMLVVSEIDNVYDIAKMEVSQKFDGTPPEGQPVTLTLHHQDGTTSTAHLVFSGGRWYVDLPLPASGTNG